MNDKIHIESYIAALTEAKRQIDLARGFLRGSSYSTDRLVALMKCSIDEHIKDMVDSNRVLGQKK